MEAKDIVQLLLDNPYPHDLMKIRQTAENYFSEEEARNKMEAYCTTEFLIDALHKHYAAHRTAHAWMEEQEAVS
jgi:hypothetical protein